MREMKVIKTEYYTSMYIRSVGLYHFQLPM